MRLTDLKSKIGSRRKRKTVGRGRSSGHGKTCCRGNNGQGQRAGKGNRAGFEGGQTPLYRRLPKYQTNERTNRVQYTVVNLSQLNALSKSSLITPELLIDKGIVDNLENGGIKILGEGELKFAPTIKANKYSESAKKKIESAGGKWEIIENKRKTK